MVALKRYSMQLSEKEFGNAIIADGGVCMVCKTGTPDKASVYNPDSEQPIANPVPLVRGHISFAVGADIGNVDIYVQTPLGQFIVLKDIIASGDNELVLQGVDRYQTYVIPFSAADSTPATETDTGFTIPNDAILLPQVALRVTAVDATETIDVGTATADSGDPDLLIALASVAALGLVATTLAANNIVSGGKSIVYTLSAGSDTAKGFITIPVLLAA